MQFHIEMKNQILNARISVDLAAAAGADSIRRKP